MLLIDLPCWIKSSDFVNQFEVDFPEEKSISLAADRVFEFPLCLTKNNIYDVLDNVRYFGINDKQLFYFIFLFFVKYPSLVENVRHRYSELEFVLWDQVLFKSRRQVNFKFVKEASSLGYLFCLKYVHEKKCDWGDEICAAAAMSGHLDCLEFLHENGCPWSVMTTFLAAYKGQIHCLKYAHENGCPWDERTCSNAAMNGHLECLMYAHANGCSSSAAVCRNASGGGHLHCLQYAHETANMTWDIGTCLEAAEYGHLDCLKYAHENGCPWDERTCSKAALNGYHHCLLYAHENGCPWDESTLSRDAVIGGSEQCIVYSRQIQGGDLMKVI
jgi:hypothetical protein